MVFLPETDLSESAKASKYRHNWIIELLIAILLFAVSQAAETLFFVVSILMLFMSNQLISVLPLLEGYGEFILLYKNDIELIIQLHSTFTIIVVCILYCILIEKRSLSSIGFSCKHPAFEYIKGFLCGIIMFSSAVLLCKSFGNVNIELSKTINPVIYLLYISGFMIQGLSEEVLCRGYLMQSLSTKYSPIVSVLINSLFFASLHLFNNGISFISIVNLLLFGVFASLYFWKHENILGIAALHSAWNLSQGNLFGIKVSGIEISSSFLKTEFIDMSNLFTGGTFGLEGGLSVTIVLSICTVILFLMQNRK